MYLRAAVMDPILFNLFISPLGKIIRSHGLSFKGYTVDSQNYLTFRPIKNNPQPQQECVSWIENCLSEVKIMDDDKPS